MTTVGGRFEIKKLIAKGGVAEIYEAYDKKLGIKVALKLPRSDVSFDASKLLLNEARALSTLNHPYIVRLIAAGRHKGRPYVALELLKGRPLSKILTPPINSVIALDLTLEVADAVAYANSLGTAHRDVKPANIIVSPRRLVLIDFSVSAPLNGRGPKAETPGFSCPEAALGLVTPTCDTYSLAALLCWLVTGDPQKPGGPYWRLLAACLNPDPSQRPWSPREFVMALREFAPLGPRLVISGKAYPLARDKPIRIGRMPGCEVTIRDPNKFVSPIHAIIYPEERGYIIVDNNSLNGLFLYRNGRYYKIQQAQLVDGDIIILCYSEKKGPYVVIKYRSY